MEDLQPLTEAALTEVADATALRELDEVRVKYLGKKGSISTLLKSLGKLSAEERPKAGAVINEARQQVQAAIEARKAALENAALAEQLASETIDVTLPGRGEKVGGLHPVTRIRRRIEDFFIGLGYAIAEGDRKSTRLNCSHVAISYAGFCWKKKRVSCYGHSCLSVRGTKQILSCLFRCSRLRLCQCSSHL